MIKKLTFLLFRFSHRQKKARFFNIKEGPQQKMPVVYPNQYPNTSLIDTSPIISRSRPLRHLTPKYQIPTENLMQEEALLKEKMHPVKWKSPENSFGLNVGLIGPVNAGKSELFGVLAHRISAVSSKASTTIEITQGIKSFQKESEEGIKNIQIKYFDTPGLMYKKEGFISKGWKVLSQIDFSLLVVDSAKRFDQMVKQSIKRLEKHRQYPNFMKALVLNKIDLVDNRRKFDQLIREIEKYGKFDKVFYTSARTGYGVEELQQYLMKMAKPRQWEYPADVKTTMTKVQIVEEMLREGIFQRSYKQLPHDVDVQCVSISQLSNNKDEIIFNIFVGTQNQQRMVIGKEGRNIKQMYSRFKILYAKLYGRQSEAIATVKIRNKFREKFRGREQIFIEDEDRVNYEKLKILTHSLETKRSSGDIRTVDKPKN